jgi:hypothetical protein
MKKAEDKSTNEQAIGEIQLKQNNQLKEICMHVSESKSQLREANINEYEKK